MSSSSLLPNSIISPVTAPNSRRLSPGTPSLLPLTSRDHKWRRFSRGSAIPSQTKTPSAVASSSPVTSSSSLQALIFDCDGVILESEHLHRQAYNDTFIHFNVRCSSSLSEPVNWGLEFYDELQNRIGGGKPKMRWFVISGGKPTFSL